VPSKKQFVIVSTQSLPSVIMFGLALLLRKTQLLTVTRPEST
jgi:hypothetical protein